MKKPRAVQISPTAMHQLMAMDPKMKQAALDAIARISEEPDKGIPAEEFLKTLPKEQADAIRADLRAAMEDIEEDPSIH